MKKVKKIEWEEITRRGKAHHLLMIDSVIELYRTKLFGKAHRVKWNPSYYRQFNNARWFSQNDFNKYLNLLQEGEKKKQISCFSG